MQKSGSEQPNVYNYTTLSSNYNQKTREQMLKKQISKLQMKSQLTSSNP